jgi:4-aminobutyrate aminotransferase-like enzyme
MKPAEKVVHAAGGVLISDEVQPGFGRTGDSWWGYEWLGLSPDVVTLGKPMANGHPVAAVVARASVMSEFRNAFGYFNTFGGNPVSCAAASATLDVIEEDGLIANSKIVGHGFLERLQAIKHGSIASVRGRGLFIALELETDGIADEVLAAKIVEYARNNGMLMGRTGRNRNILKLRPPMPFNIQNAREATNTLTAAFKNF